MINIKNMKKKIVFIQVFIAIIWVGIATGFLFFCFNGQDFFAENNSIISIKFALILIMAILIGANLCLTMLGIFQYNVIISIFKKLDTKND
jgi:hypothetical protein